MEKDSISQLPRYSRFVRTYSKNNTQYTRPIYIWRRNLNAIKKQSQKDEEEFQK